MTSRITLSFLIERDDEEIELEIEADYSPGSPAVHYLKNGDPGYPEEPAEIDILGAVDENGMEWELTMKEKEEFYFKVMEEIAGGLLD